MIRLPRIADALTLAIVLVASTALAPPGHTAGDAKGTLSYKSKTVTFKHAYLVTGPDAINPKKMVRRVILSGKDIGAKVRNCQAMSCTDGEIMEGLVVDIDGGPRLNYWVALDDQRVQYSGTQRPAALKATADEPKRLAGKLSFDDAAAGGPKVDVEFDAALVKELKAAR
jgi:hypothetical protein